MVTSIMWVKFLIPLLPLRNIEITKYVSYEIRFNRIFPRYNLSKIKDRAYVINPDDKKSKGTHFTFLFFDRNTAVYLDSFGNEYSPQDVLNKIKVKSITYNNIFRIQSDDSIIYGLFCIAFIEYMIAEKTSLDYTNLHSPNDYQKNNKIINKYFKNKYHQRKRKPWPQIKEKVKQDISYLLDQRKRNDLTSEKHKKLCRGFNSLKHVLVLFLLSVDVFQFLYFLY